MDSAEGTRVMADFTVATPAHGDEIPAAHAFSQIRAAL